MPSSRIAVLLAIFSIPVSAQDSADASLSGELIQCPLPQVVPIELKEDLSDSYDSIVIESKTSETVADQATKFSGGVTLAYQDKRILAEEILIDRDAGKIRTSGDTRFQDGNITIQSAQLEADNNQNSVIMSNSNYQLGLSPGRGAAEQLNITEQGVTLEHASFTSCIDATPDWSISASEINLSTEDNAGSAYHTVFRVKDIPVLYLPYFTFPLTDERKTGFLYPQISSSSKSGFELGVPFYWNIRENMDATITPYFMSKRGTQIRSQFRYLVDEQYGQVDFEYLGADDELSSNEERYLGRYQHMGTFSDNFRVFVDYSDISDDNYLVDLESDQFSSTDAYLWRIGELSYFAENWQSSIKVQGLKVLGDRRDSYQTLPQLDFQAYQPLGFMNTSFNVFGEYSRFEIDDPTQPEADRLHIEAGFALPYAMPGWFVNSDVRLMHTRFQQYNIENSPLLEEDVTRTLPKARIHAGLKFDRFTSYFNQNYVQTLEPQLQYLYIPNKDQSMIGEYDTTKLQDDFDGLFRDRRYSGLDKIARANQISWGVTSRLLDDSNAELFRLSLGQIVYFNDSNINFNEENEPQSESALAADLFLQLTDRWQFRGDIQYDAAQNSTEKSQLTIDYRKNERNLVQLNHHYIRNLSGSGEEIEQVSALTSFPISRHWQFIGHVTEDLVRSRSLEAYTGLQYESCCWAVRVAYYRNINTNLDQQDFLAEDRKAFDTGVTLQFVLKGLGGEQKPLAIDDMLRSGIFGYKRPYFLSN
ncbi:LPS assembly protein LptD [Thalassotalea mangrovi]|uniref:LPS-assembly protein LptD n=1 Tax=Thalassotalea mangrovi TaxID=2572245 RepID=A0A4U1B8S5_9GAMM|nr:LPS assembly protein LptD [Thalassotalea mangrovi]TKB46925.1 LPS assembly protein LptD [Thalassotalea mangrovi]